MSGLIEHARAEEWLPRQEPGSAQIIIYDPPYSRWTPTRGKEDGAAGSVAGPWELMHRTLRMCTPLLAMPPEPYQKPEHKGYPVGVVVAFCDWELMADLKYIASLVGLREHHHLAWCRTRNGGGAMFRGASDPVLVLSRISPRPVDHAYHTPNWFVADHELPRPHPYSKPVPLLEYIMGRVARKGGLILDPFAGSGASRTAAENLKLDLVWRGCDIDENYAEEN